MTTLVIFHVVCPVVYPNLTFQHRYFAQYILLLETGGKACGQYCCMSSPSQRVVVNRSVISCCSWLDVDVGVNVDVSVGVHVAVDVVCGVDVDVVVYVDVGG